MSDTSPATGAKDSNRIASIRIDDASIARGNANIEHEREVAIFDILDGNSFALDGIDKGPYRLEIALADDRLVLSVFPEGGTDTTAVHTLAMTPLKRLLKDYFMVLDSYYQAIRSGQPSRIEAIDVGRRGLHDEGSRMLQERLAGKITLDFDTARRLFTLITALHWKG
ncbi:MAG: UPF0262 family protein [Hyphomicrobium sp.]|jgi:uncharacterized protein (UPF0262 family)|nr:UPF0262 family protein [Hyphomicrobium sp.]